MRFETIMAVKIQVVDVFWVVMPCRVWQDTNVSEIHAASIFTQNTST
jgi:hypothetical protein